MPRKRYNQLLYSKVFLSFYLTDKSLELYFKVLVWALLSHTNSMRQEQVYRRGNFYSSWIKNANSSLLNKKQKLKGARNHHHVHRNSWTLLVAIIKHGKGTGDIMRARVALPFMLRWPAVKTINSPFMFIYCKATQIGSEAQNEDVASLLSNWKSIYVTAQRPFIFFLFKWHLKGKKCYSTRVDAKSKNKAQLYST